MLGLHHFLLSVSIFPILQPLFGISLQVLASTPRNLPIFINFSLFNKIFPSLHQSSSSFMIILSLTWYNVFLFNFISFSSFSETSYWLMFDIIYRVNNIWFYFGKQCGFFNLQTEGESQHLHTMQ